MTYPIEITITPNSKIEIINQEITRLLRYRQFAGRAEEQIDFTLNIINAEKINPVFPSLIIHENAIGLDFALYKETLEAEEKLALKVKEALAFEAKAKLALLDREKLALQAKERLELLDREKLALQAQKKRALQPREQLSSLRIIGANLPQLANIIGSLTSYHPTVTRLFIDQKPNTLRNLHSMLMIGCALESSKVTHLEITRDGDLESYLQKIIPKIIKSPNIPAPTSLEEERSSLNRAETVNLKRLLKEGEFKEPTPEVKEDKRSSLNRSETVRLDQQPEDQPHQGQDSEPTAPKESKYSTKDKPLPYETPSPAQAAVKIKEGSRKRTLLNPTDKDPGFVAQGSAKRLKA